MSISSIEDEVYILPMSYAQERIWFFEQMVPRSPTYNIPFILKIKGSVHPETLRKTLMHIVERHEVLRTTICEVKGKPKQRVSLHNTNFSFILKEKKEIEKDAGFEKYLKEFALEPFDLEKGPLIRFELINMEENCCYLLMNVHHIIFDAWSVDLLKQEIISIYTMLENGNEIELEPLELQYADYANWERELLEGKNQRRKMQFWKRYLQNAPPALDLPTDYRRPTQQTYKGDNIKFKIPDDLVIKSRTYTRSSASTLYSFFLAVFNVLLYKYSGQKDIIVGSPVSNRSEEFTQKLIGFFVNTLPIRSKIMPYSTFDNFLKRLIKNFFQVHENSEIPFEKIVKDLKPERNANTHPFFQVMFTLNDQLQTSNSLGIEIETERINTQSSKFDFVLYLNCSEEEGYGEIEYNPDLFQSETIHRMIRHYLVLLEEILKDSNKPIKQLNMLSKIEKEELLSFKKATYPTSLKFVHELFEQQVKMSRHHCALIDKDSEWTYNQLNSRANQIANQLLSEGISSNSIIGVQIKRSNAQIAALLGILKAGCSYIPIDPGNPDERTEFILRDAGAALLITDKDSRKEINKFPVINVKDSLSYSVVKPNISIDIHSNELGAYVIYTSGTTGKPKGLKTSHASLINHLENMMQEFPYMENERVLQNINYTFDPSTTEIFGSLLSGTTLVLTELDKQFDVEYLAHIISEQKITRAQILHGLLEKLLEIPGFTETKMLQYVFTGGEKLNRELVRKFYQAMPSRIPLINLYGPSESSVASTYYRCKLDDHHPITPIGKPFRNYQLVVLDESQELVPNGVAGELYIGGAGLSTGYINNPTLNEYSFLDLDLANTGKTERYYRTGDLVKRLDNGEFIFISRKDSQVKIRGFRIEPDEVKQLILSYPEIRAAAVQVKAINNDKKLFAFLVKHKRSTVTANEIKSRLSNQLPYYMVPNAIVWMEELPLTKHGKVDMHQLPFEHNDLLSRDKQIPNTLLEIELMNLWREVLDLEDIGVEDDFFDLGGHSIKVIELIGYIRKKHQYEVPITAIFQYRTIRTLANYLSGNKVIDTSRIIVPLKHSNSSEQPLFFIHPGGGGVLCYLPLTKHLNMDIPIYGIQSAGYDQNEEPYTSIPLMAKRYVEEIKKIQSKGPYRIAGWSMGGTIAFEMAKILRKAGEDVSFIGLLDAHPFDGSYQLKNPEKPILVWAKSLGIESEVFENKSEIEEFRIVLDAAKKKGILPVNAGIEEVKRIIHVMACNNIASDHYTCTVPIDKELIVFHCLEKSFEHFHELVNPLDWQERTTEQVKAVSITGHHNNIMDDPHVKDLGRKIAMFLKGS
ncbi:non-ribosomal peptide synthetase [Oceanobacillus sp. FSL H7-0719]|uniref:non-ribosomal peptide synthetase n=1 Tax=Oceanobacillus sp. FSL H7-0719 TaxID=2954507 RepID=UPI0032510035